MLVRSQDVIAANPGYAQAISVVPDNKIATVITVTFDKLDVNVVAEKSSAQKVGDLIKNLLGDVIGILGDTLALVLSPGTVAMSALSGKAPPQINDAIDKGTDFGDRILNFDLDDETIAHLNVPAIELNTTCKTGYTVGATATIEFTRGAGRRESATANVAIGWLGALFQQGGVSGAVGTATVSLPALLDNQSGEQGYATPSLDITLKAKTDGDPSKKRRSESKLTKVVFVLRENCP